MIERYTIALILGLQSSLSWSFADEDRDWQVPQTRDLRQAPYSAPTPLQIPGARTISTTDLHDMLVRNPVPLLIDVAGGDGHLTLRGSQWLPGIGRGIHFLDPVQAQTAEYLAALTNGDKRAALVFFCVNAQCWLSYNASLRAAALGYLNVFWYRGGIEAWRDAGLPLAAATPPAIKMPGKPSPDS